jgi:hypothetical protein
MTAADESGPTPREVEKWNAVLAGSGDKLFTEYVCQLRHQRRLETAKVALAFYGPLLGFLVVIGFLVTAGWLIHSGHAVAGTFLGVIDIVSLAGVFVLGERITRLPVKNADATSGDINGVAADL